MHCEYVVTYKDFLESMKGYRKVSKGAAFAYYLDIWAVPLIGVCLISSWLYFQLRGDSSTAETLIPLAIVGPIAIIGPPIFYRLKLWQAYRQRTALSKDKKVILDINAETVRFTIPGQAEVIYPWTSFTAYAATKRAITLFIQSAAFHTIPTNAMTAEELAQFKALLQLHVSESLC